MARRRRRSWNYSYFYPTSRPREVTGGIKVQSRRGSFAETWWGRRWEETIASYDIGARLSRGKTYARQGQVLEVSSSVDGISAQVQGSRSTPYRVRIGFRHWSEKEWLTVLDTVADNPGFLARLLAGEIDPELEPALAAAGVALFPEAYSDLKTNCSCPDWSNPCKHIAAVAFILVRELDHDPLLLFRYRGLEREDFFSLIRDIQGEEAGAAPVAEPSRPLAEQQETALLTELARAWPEPEVATDPVAFWRPPAGATPVTVRNQPPPVDAALARRLGPPPLWRSQLDYTKVMTRLYRALARELDDDT